MRADAADAKDAMNGADIEGHCITIGWGKAIKKLSNNPSMLGQAGGFLKVCLGVGGGSSGGGCS